MPEFLLEKDDQDILNLCAKFLARDNTDPRHNFGQYPLGDLRGRICESWRFPIVDSYSDGVDFETSYAFNEVTFVFMHLGTIAPQSVGVIGTFANLYEPIPLRHLADTPYYTVTVVVPKGEVHTYKFMVDGQAMLDPINPQRAVLDNGKAWSRFFTQLCSQPLSFERWELAILGRFTAHILPFQTAEGENFLQRFYTSVDQQEKSTQYAHAYRLDQSVGVVNFIDKVVAKEENHHLLDYKVCLRLIDRLLRQRNPFVEPDLMTKEMYIQLYQEMQTNNVSGWDYQQYNSPRYFLQLLRRHTFTGAFSHPKYGGNVGAAAWAYLEERYRNPESGQSLFDWRRIMEKPLGKSLDYHG
jgi:hypothetical protein